MAIQNKISLETRFQLNNTPENFKITDNTDYSSEGISTSDVIGALVIKSPLGLVIHSTVLPLFDIDLDVQDFIDTIQLPKDSNGNVLKGNYNIEYTIRVSGAVQPGDYVKTFIYDYCYEPIIPNVDLTVDLICSKLTSTDNTPYPTELTSTNLTHTIHPPSGLNPTEYPVQTVTTPVNEYSPITTKTWTGKIVNILELTYSDGLIVDVTITGNTEKDIKDDINLCSLQCNMRALVSRYEKALENNPIDAVRLYNDQVAPALINAFMYTSNIECGNFGKAEEYYNSVLKFTGSNPDCQCDDSEVPTLIIPTCSGGGSSLTYVVDACNTNSAITVTSNTVGSETTYTVCFDDAIWNKINALTETVITSNDSSVIITPSLNGYTMTYDLSVSPSVLPTTNQFAGIIELYMLTDNALPTSLVFKAGWSSVDGIKLQEPNIVNVNNTAPTWVFQNSFYLENYIASAGGEKPKPQLQIVERSTTISFDGPPTPPQSFSYPTEIAITKIDTINDRIYFSIVNETGLPYTGTALSELYDLIAISVYINA